MRVKYKSWQNQRPGWTRRATMYKRDEERVPDVRICFEDESGKVNRFYSTLEEAQSVFDSFIFNETDVHTLWEEIPGGMHGASGVSFSTRDT